MITWRKFAVLLVMMTTHQEAWVVVIACWEPKNRLVVDWWLLFVPALVANLLGAVLLLGGNEAFITYSQSV